MCHQVSHVILLDPGCFNDEVILVQSLSARDLTGGRGPEGRWVDVRCAHASRTLPVPIAACWHGGRRVDAASIKASRAFRTGRAATSLDRRRGQTTERALPLRSLEMRKRLFLQADGRPSAKGRAKRRVTALPQQLGVSHNW